jgi:16S rRNA processing protein RimM
VLGEATIEVQTDDPDIRFQVGNKLTLDNGRQLTIRSSRWHNQILLLAFDGVADRNQIEELRDQLISSDVDLGSLAPGEYHFQQLIGCEVFQQNGELIGKVDEIVKLPGQDLLSVSRSGAQVLIPMVKQIIIEIDVLAKKIVVNPPEGLLDVAN